MEKVSIEMVLTELVRMNAKMDTGFDRTNKEIARLDAKMDSGFNRTNNEIARLDAKMDSGFNRTNNQIARLDAKMDSGFSRVAAEFVEVRKELKTIREQTALNSEEITAIRLRTDNTPSA